MLKKQKLIYLRFGFLSFEFRELSDDILPCGPASRELAHHLRHAVGREPQLLRAVPLPQRHAFRRRQAVEVDSDAKRNSYFVRPTENTVS